MRTFLLSSFPSLSFESPSPLTFTDFLAECRRHLPSAEYEKLDAICATPSTGNTPFAKAWQQTRAQWQRVNEQKRKEALGLEKSGTTSAESDQLIHDMNAAWLASDPLLREKALYKSLWNWIVTQRRQAPFSLTDLMGYALQLQLIERIQLWNESEGLTQFKEHTHSFLEPVLEELRKQELST
ncbi:hypothetical protein P3T73_11795 [Kiritimatiellota bacterium B12222]|nr:hypothetical protein P3T73_11795 [Kiritimatiellota bacterium B12222]